MEIDFDEVGFLGSQIDSIMNPFIEVNKALYTKIDEMN